MPAWLLTFFTAVLRPLLPELGALLLKLMREERLARRQRRKEGKPDETDADLLARGRAARERLPLDEPDPAKP